MPAAEPRRLRHARTATYGTLIDAEFAERATHIWLPPGLSDADPRPVLYAWDAQSLFTGGHSISGATWELDRALHQLERVGIKAPIVVATESPTKRRAEYMPREGLQPVPELAEIFVTYNGEPRSDAAIDTIVDVVKPTIDALYPTIPDREHTHVMGSSMGGLFSLYAMSRHPDVFGSAACLSLHWAIAGLPLVHVMAANLPDPTTHRLYADHGTATLDARYLDKQPVFDALARERGWVDGDNYLSLVFDRAMHREQHWAARVVIPLLFLLAGTEVAAALAPAFGGAPTPTDVPGLLLRSVGSR